MIYGLQSRRLQRHNISSPMMMVLTGMLVAVPLGIWHGTPMNALSGSIHFATGFAEMTLAIILFADRLAADHRGNVGIYCRA